ncbi:MAG: putative Ig domain-containing protein [Planctomycetes bacterium]|jgi:hypothetical protein|nr:putative Ig domain-containing protein [Planctomycetota bacterium]
MFHSMSERAAWFSPVRVVALVVLLLSGYGMRAEAAISAPVITSPTTASGTAGVAFSYQIAATEDPTSFVAAGLPSGLSLNASTGLISGIPAVEGNTNVSIGASNAFGTGAGGVNIAIAGASGPPVISSPSFASATVGVAFNNQIVASHSPFSYSATNLPTGLSLSVTTGQISGTPLIEGTWSATIAATNLVGTATESLAITVNGATPTVPGTQPQITNSLNTSGRVGTTFSYAIQATNAPTSYGAVGLPSGLSVDAGSGLITGTPTTSAITDVTISATNADGTDSETLRISIATSSGTPPPGAPNQTAKGSSCGAGSGLSVLLLGVCWALQAMFVARGRTR